MKLAILYEDKDVFVSYTPEEFVQNVDKLLKSGKTIRQAMDQMIKDLKQRALTK